MVAELCNPVVGDVEGALEMKGEEGDEALGVGAVAVDGVLGVTAGVTAGAAVTDELGVPVVYVTFFTTLWWLLKK